MHARPILAAATSALILSACASAGTPDLDAPPPSDVTSASPVATVPAPATSRTALIGGLCAAAEATDPDTSERAFLLVHEELHAIARELQASGDRALAGRLLEAKQRVEAGFGATPVPDDIDDRLDQLLSVTGEALATAGSPTTTCDGETS